MKALKIALGIIVAIAVLLLAAIIIIPQVIDPNDYKNDIAKQVKTHTGLTMTLEGDLSLSVFPWIGVNTGRIVLEQPEAIDHAEPLADIEAIDIKVKLMPLLEQKIEVDTIVLQKPRIAFVVNKNGQNSLGQSSSATEQESEKASTDNTSNVAALTIAGLNINDGRILYVDQQAGTRYDIDQLNINSGNILNNSSAPFKIAAVITEAQSDPISLEVATNLSFDQNQLSISAKDLTASVKQAQNNIKANIEALSYEHQTASSSVHNINLSGNVADIPISLSLPKATVNTQQLIGAIPSFTAKVMDIEVSGNLEIQNKKSMALAVGDIKTNIFNAQALLKQLDIDYEPTAAAALTKVQFASHFNGTEKGVSLQKTRLAFDNSALEGNLAIINFNQPEYRFDLSLEPLTVDGYLPKTTDEQNATTETESVSISQALAAPIVGLKEINANGVFRTQQISVNNIKIDASTITVASDNKRVNITPDVKLYNGTLGGSLSLNKTDNVLSIKNKLSNISLEPLLTDAEITNQFSGTGNIDTNLVVNENNGQPQTKGTVKLLAKDGAIKGVDIKKIIDDARNVVNKLRGKQSSSSGGTDETRFAEMSATLNLNNDIITNNDLSIKAPVFRVGGEGTVNTSNQTLDYLTSVSIVGTSKGQGGKETDELGGLTIPVRFSGSLTAPNYKIDTTALLKANSNQRIEEEKDKIKDKLLQKLGVGSSASQATEQPAAQQPTQAAPEPEQSPEDQLKDKLKEKLLKKLF